MFDKWCSLTKSLSQGLYENYGVRNGSKRTVAFER